MKKNFRLVTMWYIIFLGSLLGAGLFAGILSNFQKLAYLVDFSLIVIFLYEGYKYKKFERDTITQVAIFFAIATGMLFSHYYIPDIINMQLAGEEMIKSIEFINTHKGSEINFMIFSVAILIILVKNLQKALK